MLRQAKSLGGGLPSAARTIASWRMSQPVRRRMGMQRRLNTLPSKPKLADDVYRNAGTTSIDPGLLVDLTFSAQNAGNVFP